MAIRLFSLQDVPNDEAEEITELLHENGISIYETPSGNWGASMSAIWLKDVEQLGKAKALLKAYHNERQARMHNEYNSRKQQHEDQNLIGKIRKNPNKYSFYFFVLVLVIFMLVFGVNHRM